MTKDMMCVHKEIYPPHTHTLPNNLQALLQEKDCKTTRNSVKNKGAQI